MNSLIEGEFPLAGTQSQRYELLDALMDEDLAYKLPGDNLTLGELLREVGTTELIYLESFKTFKHDRSLTSNDPELTKSREKLRAWYRLLDEEFNSVVSGFSEEEIQNKQIDRGNGFTPSLFVQFQIFREALYILYGKLSVYMKALQNPVNENWQASIG